MEFNKLKYLRAPEKYIKRQNEEEFSPLPFRTEFDRDRDRILYSKAFRRLKGKTQVFLSARADHLRTRLTHTLEVAQISRIVAYNLNLNGILTEAIAIGHDIGHTPFGHVGERTLNQIMNDCDRVGDFQQKMEESDKGFKHNWQGVRVACELEKIYGKEGINLTNFTLWGICNHSNLSWRSCDRFIDQEKYNCYLLRNPGICKQKKYGVLGVDYYKKYTHLLTVIEDNPAWSFEGFIVALSDEIAQRHHDMEDALLIGIIDKNELIDQLETNFKILYSGRTKLDITNRKLIEKIKHAKNNQELLPYLSKFIINFYTNNLILSSKRNLEQFIFDNDIRKREDFNLLYLNLPLEKVNNIIGHETLFQERDKKFQQFLKNRILNSFIAQRMDGKGKYIIRKLFKAYITNPRQLFDSTILTVFRNFGQSIPGVDNSDKKIIGDLRNEIDSPSNKSDPRFQIALLRSICDNISGMTDEFALNQFHDLYGY